MKAGVFMRIRKIFKFVIPLSIAVFVGGGYESAYATTYAYCADARHWILGAETNQLEWVNTADYNGEYHVKKKIVLCDPGSGQQEAGCMLKNIDNSPNNTACYHGMVCITYSGGFNDHGRQACALAYQKATGTSGYSAPTAGDDFLSFVEDINFSSTDGGGGGGGDN